MTTSTGRRDRETAAIVLTATGFFALAFLFAPGHGLLWQRRFAPQARPEPPEGVRRI